MLTTEWMEFNVLFTNSCFVELKKENNDLYDSMFDEWFDFFCFVLFKWNEMNDFFLMINANKFAVCVYVAVNQIFDFFSNHLKSFIDHISIFWYLKHWKTKQKKRGKKPKFIIRLDRSISYYIITTSLFVIRTFCPQKFFFFISLMIKFDHHQIVGWNDKKKQNRKSIGHDLICNISSSNKFEK